MALQHLRGAASHDALATTSSSAAGITVNLIGGPREQGKTVGGAGEGEGRRCMGSHRRRRGGGADGGCWG
jgi:hypothetical protein